MDIKRAGVTPFQTLEDKINGGKVSSVLAYFPVKGIDKQGLIFRNKDGSLQDTTYKLSISDTTNLYSLFAYRIDKKDKKKGGKYSPVKLSDALAKGYEAFADLLNELNEVTIRNFDRSPVILRIANGTFDIGEYKNQIVGSLLTYNALENSKLVQMIQDGNIANLVTGSIMTPESLDIFFRLKHSITDENIGMRLYGLIQNGTSGTVSFNFNAVIISKSGKYKYILPQVDEKGGYVKLRGRNRHMGWLDNGLAEFVAAVEKISTINYYETLQSISIDDVWRKFEQARTILINADKNPMDSEESELRLGVFKNRCRAAGYTNAMQVFDEATLFAEIRGNGQYINRLLDQTFDLIFGQ